MAKKKPKKPKSPWELQINIKDTKMLTAMGLSLLGLVLVIESIAVMLILWDMNFVRTDVTLVGWGYSLLKLVAGLIIFIFNFNKAVE